jgi:hypothetical protein
LYQPFIFAIVAALFLCSQVELKSAFLAQKTVISQFIILYSPLDHNTVVRWRVSKVPIRSCGDPHSTMMWNVIWGVAKPVSITYTLSKAKKKMSKSNQIGIKLARHLPTVHHHQASFTSLTLHRDAKKSKETLEKDRHEVVYK